MQKHSSLISNLTVDELLNALDEQDIDLSPKTSIHGLPILIAMDDKLNEDYQAVSFLEAFQIKAGSHPISGRILYELFKQWNKSTRMSKNGFTKAINNVLIGAKNGNQYVYKIDKKAILIVNYITQYKYKKKRKRTHNKNYRLHFEDVFLGLKLVAGKLFVEADVLYHVYDTYLYRLNRTPYSYNTFVAICKLFFEVKYLDGTTIPWIGISDNVKDHITAEGVRNWRQGRERFRANKNRKEVKDDGVTRTLYPEESGKAK